jgi:hypothetical protein
VTRALPWLVIAVLVGVLVLARNGVTHDREREAIRVADSVYVTDTVRLTRVHNEYVSLRDTLRLTDTVQVRQFVHSADSTISTCRIALSSCDSRVAVRDALIKSLRPARLLLYGEAGVSVPPSFLGARMDGEAGIALRLDRNTHLQAGATTGGDLRLSVRRQLKLF